MIKDVLTKYLQSNSNIVYIASDEKKYNSDELLKLLTADDILIDDFLTHLLLHHIKTEHNLFRLTNEINNQILDLNHSIISKNMKNENTDYEISVVKFLEHLLKII